MKVGLDSGIGQQRHSTVIVRVAADQVARGQSPSGARISLDPAGLSKKGRRYLELIKDIEQPLLYPGLRRPVGVFGVEGQRDPQSSYFSTPVITMPRTKTRWKITKIRTGTMSVIKVPAWI